MSSYSSRENTVAPIFFRWLRVVACGGWWHLSAGTDCKTPREVFAIHIIWGTKQEFPNFNFQFRIPFESCPVSRIVPAGV
jgi:hypothetical protein